VPVEQTRQRIRLAGQDAHLLAGTIAANVRIGRPDATDADVREALTDAGLADWLHALPDGIDTRVGEDGVAVSGGQRQRIGLARALISPAEIIVLDEDVVALGDRSGDDAPVRVIGLDALRAGDWAVPSLPYWVHVDADVLRLDAVDSPQPDGLSFDELADVLRRLRPGAVGMHVTIFDPDLDPDGTAAEALTDCLVRAALP
jgi:ABC-type molybdate transport system ATPase subunit